MQNGERLNNFTRRPQNSPELNRRTARGGEGNAAKKNLINTL